MLCAREERLEDLLVRAVIYSGAAKADELFRRVNIREGSWSLAATYKALRKLVESGVVVHSKGRYYISQSWVFALSSLLDRHLELPLGASGGEHLLPSPGGTFSWRYTDLRRLNSFATNIILVATRNERASMIYSWSPHLWFNLIQLEHEKHYHNSLRELGTRVVKVIGGNSPLDYETAAVLPKSIVSTHFIAQKSFLPRNHYTIIVENYIITMKLQRKVGDEIDTLFARAKDLASIDTRLLLKLFRYNATTSTLTVEHNSREAARLAQRFIGRCGHGQ